MTCHSQKLHAGGSFKESTNGSHLINGLEEWLYTRPATYQNPTGWGEEMVLLLL
jgi:antibiotic biosynthesis monooxygenase (ABM) superfamily enzyme